MKDFSDLTHAVSDAALAAEFEITEHDETAEEARAHVAIRLARISLGLAVVILGIAMMVLPGPGALAIAGGLFILAKDVAWADRLLLKLRKKVPGIPDDGGIPRSQMVTMATMTLGALAASAWWTWLR